MISMKKIFDYLLIATLLIGTAVSFSSCKDDDKENENIPVNNGGGTGTTNGGGTGTTNGDGTGTTNGDGTGTTSSTYNIIGTWKWSDGRDYSLLTLNSNGTFIWTDVDYTYGTDTEYGAYTYSNGVLTFFVNDEIDTLRIKWLNANSFQDEDGDIWVRQ